MLPSLQNEWKKRNKWRYLTYISKTKGRWRRRSKNNTPSWDTFCHPYFRQLKSTRNEWMMVNGENESWGRKWWEEIVTNYLVVSTFFIYYYDFLIFQMYAHLMMEKRRCTWQTDISPPKLTDTIPNQRLVQYCHHGKTRKSLSIKNVCGSAVEWWRWWLNDDDGTKSGRLVWCD